MSYKPDEGTLIAYLYGELEGAEKEKIERYLFETPEAMRELENLQRIRSLLGTIEDKEVIAPPLVIDNGIRNFWFPSRYLRTILGVAASLLLLLVAGRMTGLHIRAADRTLTISFGEAGVNKEELTANAESDSLLTPMAIQRMIDASLSENNSVIQDSWKDSQAKLDASIQRNLALNSSRIDKLVNEASQASQQQITAYVSTLQTQNLQFIKDYYQLTAAEQKQYIEELLVDFAKYLQQQRNDDLTLMQTRMNNIEQNTGLFQQETEQILSSIISNSSLNVIKNQ